MNDERQIALERAEFEAWFASSRRNKGIDRRPTFARREDDTYDDDHTQRHWWTWQQAQANLTARLQREVEVLRAERDQARASVDRAVQLLTGIHALLYPSPLTMPDGRTLVFRPTSPDPHAVLQALSDRIRALPDELQKLSYPCPAPP
ncbi:MAG: hypothetical protein KF863_21655 [Rubrivivax sp.]|nr:hypothetical protein [Rubrivivax sp.]